MRTFSPACSCVAHECPPDCKICGDTDPLHRFTSWNITEFKPDCPQHSYLFRTNIAAELRYGD